MQWKFSLLPLHYLHPGIEFKFEEHNQIDINLMRLTGSDSLASAMFCIFNIIQSKAFIEKSLTKKNSGIKTSIR